MLTTYTKINKSASIFLGGHPKNSVTDPNGQTRPTSTFQHSRPPSAGPNRPPNATSGRPPISRQSSLLQNRPGSGSVGRSVNMSSSDSNIGKKKEGEGTIEVTPKTITGWEDTPKFGKAFLVGLYMYYSIRLVVLYIIYMYSVDNSILLIVLRYKINVFILFITC